MGERIKSPVEILLVEDNASDIHLMEEAFQKCGMPYRLRAVQEIAAALTLVRREGSLRDQICPDLIILDIQLSKGAGTDFLRVVKADEKLKMIPVIIMSSSKSERDVLTCYGLHANCYITKPIRFHDLERIIRNLMNFWADTVILPRI